MTALEETRRPEKHKKEKDDGLFSVTLCQIIFTVIAVLSLLVLSKSGGTAAQNIKDDFGVLMNNSFLKGNVSDTLKSIKDYLDSPAELSVFKLFTKETTNPAEVTDVFEPTDENEASKPETTEEDSSAFETKESKESEPEEETTPKASTAEKTAEKVTAKKTSLSSSKTSGNNKADSKSVSTVAAVKPLEAENTIVSPVNGWYSSYYGYRTNPITGNNTLHTGIDIAAAQGTKIKAAYSGVVRKVGEDSRSGKYLYLTHSDGSETLYCHCSKILAEEGAVIRQGETVALVGSTGWSTGPHLHFEIHKNGERLDPLPFLKNDD